VAEDEPQQADLLRAPASGGSGLDVLYNDDFHHAARVRLTGWREAYYSDYHGSTSELLACVQHGFIFQGQRSGWQGQRRGTSALDFDTRRFLCYLENHDQVANSTRAGLRLHQVTAPGMLRAFTALLLLGPWTPLLFQGQEHGVCQPWVYFADHPGDLGVQVREGRREFKSQFTRMPAAADHEGHPDPMSPTTYAACRLDLPDAAAAEGAAGVLWRLHHDLLDLRRTLVRAGSHDRLLGAAPDDTLLLLRGGLSDAPWLLVVNLGSDRDVATLASPLVAPPAGGDWRLHWSSEAVAYGGSGVPALHPDRWLMPGASATLLVAGTVGLHDTRGPDDE
jgi:maltooligosyltrehalose trehalohydrolase